MKQLLIVNTLRGSDSTGIFAVPIVKGGETRVFKRAVEGTDFVNLKQTESILTNIEKFWAVVGHNRAATLGKVNSTNAHPFQIGNITLVHNGTLKSMHTLPDHKEFSVDSELIAHSINEWGIERTIKELHGAFALVWHDARTNLIHMIRNDERPLYFGIKTDKKGVIFGSELGMLKWISTRNGYNIDDWFHLVPGSMVTFTKGDLANYGVTALELKPKIDYTANYNVKTNGYIGWDKKKEDKSKLHFGTDLYMGDVIEFEMDRYEPYNAKSSRGFVIGKYVEDKIQYTVKVSDCDSSSDLQIGKKLKATITGGSSIYKSGTGSTIFAANLVIPSKDKKSAEVYIKGPKSYISLTEFNKLISTGCAWCSDNLNIEDADFMSWTVDNFPVCPECTENLGNYSMSVVGTYTR